MIDWLTFSPSDLAGQYELLRALFEYLPQLLVGQSLEERHLAQFFKGRHGELSLAGIIGKPTCMRVSPGSEQTRRAPQSFSTIPRATHIHLRSEGGLYPWCAGHLRHLLHLMCGASCKYDAIHRSPMPSPLPTRHLISENAPTPKSSSLTFYTLSPLYSTWM